MPTRLIIQGDTSNGITVNEGVEEILSKIAEREKAKHINPNPQSNFIKLEKSGRESDNFLVNYQHIATMLEYE